MNAKSLLLALSALSLAFGCQEKREKTPGFYYGEKQVSFGQLRDDDCVVRVNGVSLTKCQWTALYRLDTFISGLQNGVFGDGGLDERAFAPVSGAVLIDLIRHELFRQYAERNSLVPGEEAVRLETERLRKSMKKGTSLSFERLCAAAGGELGPLLAQVPYQDARNLVLWQSVTTNDLTSVSPAELAERERFVKAFDDNAARLNAQSREKLLRAKGEMQAGTPFAEVASRYAEIAPEDAHEWCTVELDELPPGEALMTWLSTAAVGEVSDPLDLEDGLALVKLVSTGLGDPPPGVEPPKTYTLVRCTVRAYEHMRYQTPVEMSRQLLYWKWQEANKALCVKLFSEAVVEYPNGTNFFPRAENPVKEAL